MQLVNFAIGYFDLFPGVFGIALFIHLSCQTTKVKLLSEGVKLLLQVRNTVNSTGKLRN